MERRVGSGGQAVRRSGGPGPELFDANAYAANDDDWYYAVAPDDQHFLMILRSIEGDAGTQGWILVENMLPELETMAGKR